MMKKKIATIILSAACCMPAAFVRAQNCTPCGPDGWAYVADIYIDNTGNSNTLTDYQVLIYVDTQTPIQQGKMDSTGKDIRFTSDCSALLNYWIEGPMNSDSTKIWVKVPLIAGSSTDTIHINYGNPNATAMSDPDSTFIRVINGVQLAYNMDQSSGNSAFDLSGNNYNGNITGATWSTNGKFGNSLNFNGNQYVATNFNPYENQPYSISAWINISTASGEKMISGSCSTAWNGYWFEMNGSNIRSYHQNGSCSISGSEGIGINTWYLVNFVYDGSAYRHYLNGNLTNSQACVFGTDYGTIMYLGAIGSYNLSNWTYRGNIDQYRFYDQALTQSEITDIYNNYGYVTPLYPNHELIRQYALPEPVASVDTEQPNGSLSIITSGTDLQCNSDSSGTATTTPTGGMTPYTYQWDANTGNQTDSTATGLGAGTYVVTVTDNNGCTDADTVTLSEPPALTLAVSSTDDVEQSCVGTATALPGGGAPPYGYQWDANTGNQTLQTATALCEGAYFVSVTDGNGCLISDSAVIGNVSGIGWHAEESDILIYPNPSNGELTIFGNNAGKMIHIRILNSIGELVYSESFISKSNLIAKQLDLTFLEHGVYLLQLHTEYNTKTQTFIIR